MNDSENLKARRNLKALVELSRVINSSLDLEFILNNLLLTCLGKFLTTRGFIALNLNGSLQPRAKKGITDEQFQNFPVIKNKTELQSEQFKEYLTSINILAFDEICSFQECLGIIKQGSIFG